jgi:hypothetical protein
MSFKWFDRAYLDAMFAGPGALPSTVRRPKRQPRAAPPEGGKFKWRWDRLFVRANTKSEARARMNAFLLSAPPRCGRLPPGANVVRVA